MLLNLVISFQKVYEGDAGLFFMQELHVNILSGIPICFINIEHSLTLNIHLIFFFNFIAGKYSRFNMNITVLEGNPYSKWYVLGIRLGVAYTVSFLCIFLNAITLYILHKPRDLFGDTTAMILKCLSAADLVNGIYIFLTENINLLTRLPFTWESYCYFLLPLSFNQLTLSSFFLSCLTIERYIAVTYPLRHPIILSTTRTKKVLIAGAIFVLSLSVLFVSNDRVIFSGRYFSNDTYLCHTSVTPNFASPIWVIFATLSFSILLTAITLTTAINVCLLRVAIGHARKQRLLISRFQAASEGSSIKCELGKEEIISSKTLNLNIKCSEVKALKSVLVIVLAYYVTWLPFTAYLLNLLISGRQPSPLGIVVSYYLVYSNSWINNLIYMVMYKSFRKLAMEFLRLRR